MSGRRRGDTIRAIDLFCGAGGLSHGLALACEQLGIENVELAAINHSDVAIETHKRNHPWATHYNVEVEDLKPRAVADEVFDSERVDILVAGPQCTHFSGARGGRPIDDQKRASPWHVLDWMQKLYVDNVLVENVPEFRSWGPVGADGRPLSSMNGVLFEKYLEVIESLDYDVTHDVLCAADYGDPTTRRRLFLVARRNQRARFPEPTHIEGGGANGTAPWRPASEIIDWSDPGMSIWTRDRDHPRVHSPLKNKTMRRMAEGIRRYGHDDLEPFAEALAEIGRDDVYALREDVVDVEDAPEAAEEREEPFLVRGPAPEPVEAPSDRYGLCVPYLMGQHGGSVPRDATSKPVPTIATRGMVHLFYPQTYVLPRDGAQRGPLSNPPYPPEERPLHTVTAQNHDGWVYTPIVDCLIPLYNEREDQDPRTHSLEAPHPTVPRSKVPTGLMRAFLTKYYGNSDVCGVDEPLPTVTTKDRFALCVPELYPWGLDVRFRMLKPDELAAAQGFPDDYEFAGDTKGALTEQIGNAVPVNLSTALCEHLLADRDPTLASFSDESVGVADD